LETPYPIRMAQPVAQALNVPLYTMVFDSAIWYLQSLFVDRWTIAEVCRAFDRSVSASKCCAVISENMASEYEARYGIRTQIVQHCFDLSLAQTPLDRLPERDTFRIGLAGQIYAWDAWSTLLALGDILKWRIRGRKLIVRYLGRGLGMETKVPRHIEYLGWHNQAEATKLLAECDLLYCPYPFYSAEESVNRLSFPSKIPSYLASARPTFFHGPEYSSVAKFFRDTDSGLVCSTLTKSAVYNEIERIFFEPDLYGRLCRNAVQTLNNYFSLEIMRRNFANFLEFNIN
jgi:hypothetical protein